MSNKVDSKLIVGPVTELCGDPKGLKQASGEWDGEPSLPKRSDNSGVPELTRDTAGGLPSRKG